MGKMKKDKKDAYNKMPQISPRTPRQHDYWNELSLPMQEDGQVVIACGSAGTGKTWMATAKAAQRYLRGEIDKIIITRPMCETGGQSKIGALPGELDEKYGVWVSVVRKMLEDFLGRNKVNCDWGKRIIAEPLDYMRGRTFDKCFIIGEEIQNSTWEQVKMLTTRVGKYSCLVLTGDDKQVDLNKSVRSGFIRLIEEIDRQKPPIEVIRFKAEDNQRSGISKVMVQLFDAAE